MKLFKRFFSNLPITAKIVFVVLFISFVYLVKEASYMYITLKGNVEELVGTRIEYIAKTAALVVNGDTHTKLAKAYRERDPELTKRKDFKKVQRILRRIQRVNELGSDIYTLIQPQWKENSLVFITMSNRKTYVGNSVPMNPYARKTLSTGTPTHTKFYSDARGTWISSYAPIKNKKKDVVALVAVDYRVDTELNAAATQVIQWAGFPSALLLIGFIFLGVFAGRSISRPLKDITDAVVSDDDTPIGLATDRKDEIGALMRAVGAHLDNNSRDNTTASMKLKSLEGEHHSLVKNFDNKQVELKRTIQAYQALLSKLKQGCFIFLRNGNILPHFSLLLEEYLDHSPENKLVWDYLKIDQSLAQDTLDDIFVENVPVEKSFAKLPQSIRNDKGKKVSLSYYPLRNASKEITAVVALTELESYQPKQEVSDNNESEVQFADKLVRYKHQAGHYIRNTLAGLHVVKNSIHNESVLKSTLAQEILEEIRTGAQLFSLKKLENATTLAEEALKGLQSNPYNATFKTAFEEKTTHLIEAVEHLSEEGEEILGTEIHSDDHTLQISHRELMDFSKEITKAESTKEIKESFDAHFVREPIQKFVGHFEEVLQQFAKKHRKNLAPLKISGGELRIIPERYLELFAALLHPLKNAVEFGIETPAERLAASKPEQGQISLHFTLTQENDSTGWLFVTVEDDGIGMDAELIKKALDPSFEKASAYQVIQQVLKPTFTTARNSESTSVRGEGLSQLQKHVTELDGTVEINTIYRKGTQISIMVPYEEETDVVDAPLQMVKAA